MARPRKDDQSSRTPEPDRRDGRRTTLAVPRAWLIALTILLVLPWLVAGGLYLRELREDRGVDRRASAAAAYPRQAEQGRWGRLTLTPIVVSPPLEYVAADWGREPGPDVWYFPATSGDLLETFLAASGLPHEDVARLRASARADSRIQGLTITPDPEMVRRFDPQVRSRIYMQLAESQLNFDQANSFRFFGSSPAEWLGGELISDETRQLVEPLIYHAGGFMHFADVEAARARIADPAELRRLAKTLLRERTFLVRLSVPAALDVDALSQYWGIGGRRLDLRPLLESVAGAGPDASIDIVHLLPFFARDHLYRYPRTTTGDLNKPVLANCLWTVHNFFRAEADDRFLDVDTALAALRNDYYIVESGFQLGDILALLDEEGDLFHAAVHLADDLVFTKNGTSPMAPWTIMTLDQLKAYYLAQTAAPRLIYHRRKDL